MIDTHAHIYDSKFDNDLEEVLKSATAAGVKKVLMPNIDVHSIDNMLSVEQKYPHMCYSMMGLHPCYVKEDFKEQLNIISEWFNRRSFLAVGEIGTDLHWDTSYWDQQVKAFHFQCELALAHQLPIVIHCRESIDETIKMVSEYKSKDLKGVFHCFTGSQEQAKQITNMGFYIGLGGVSTFKSGGMDKIIPHIDSSKILLETDAPYLAPVPKRGKRNEPAYLCYICEKIAQYLCIDSEEVEKITTDNANFLFFSKE